MAQTRSLVRALNGRRFRIYRAVMALMFAAAVIAWAPDGARAHLNFADSSPSGGSVVDQPVTQVTLRFTKMGTLRDPGIRLLDAQGERIAAQVEPASEGAVFVLTPDAPLEPGRYGVAWRIAAPDAHPKSGGFTFEVRAPDVPGAGAASPPADAASPPTPDAGDALDEALAPASLTGPRLVRGVGRALMYAGTLVGLGALLFLVLATSATRRVISTQFGVVRTSGIVLMGGAVVAYLARVWLLGTGADDPWASLGDALADSAGVGMALAFAGGALMAFTARIAYRADPDRAGRFRGSIRRARLAAVGAALAVVAALLAGHSQAVGPTWLMWSMDIVHIVAAAVWLGGIALLVGMMRRADHDAADCAVSTIRFSSLASAAFVLAGVTGLVMALLILPTASALWTTTWGVLLLVKVALVAVVAVLGAWNHLSVVPRLRAASSDPDITHLRGTAIAEAALLALVVIVTAALVAFSP